MYWQKQKYVLVNSAMDVFARAEMNLEVSNDCTIKITFLQAANCFACVRHSGSTKRFLILLVGC